MRINGVDQRFEELLMNIRKRELKFQDLELLRSRRESVLSPAQRSKFQFVPRIYPRNSYSREYNKFRVEQIDHPSVLVKPELIDSSAPASVISEEDIFSLAIGARVRFSRPLDLNGGLVTGTPGVVVDFIFKENYPFIILVRFENIIAKTIDGLTPVGRIKESYKNSNTGISYTVDIFLLALNFAFSVHLAQGQTIPQVAIFLDDREFFVNQTYVCLSRAVSISSIIILDKEIRESRFQSPHFFRGFSQAKEEYCRLGISHPIFENHGQ